MLSQGAMSSCASTFLTSTPAATLSASTQAAGVLTVQRDDGLHSPWQKGNRLPLGGSGGREALKQLAAGHRCCPGGLDPSGRADMAGEQDTQLLPAGTGSASSGKNTSHKKALNAFVVSAKLPPYAALQDLYS